MSDYIRIKDLDLPELDDGQQIKMNHPHCPAGTDTKQRLFVTRKGAKTLAYCHNCQLSGVMTGEHSHIRRGGENLLLKADKLELPSDITFERDKQPVEHVIWLHQYGITRTTQQQYRLGWSEKWGRTILPIYDPETADLVAFQRRRVLKYDQGPKYLTTRLRRIKNPLFKLYHGAVPAAGDWGTLVLTEDILSAIKLHQAGYFAWSLLGTYMVNSVVDQIAATGVERVVIWLDDDNRAVRRAQKSMRRRIKQVADVEIMRHSDLKLAKGLKSDPKIFTPAQLRAHIQRKLS